MVWTPSCHENEVPFDGRCLRQGTQTQRFQRCCVREHVCESIRRLQENQYQESCFGAGWKGKKQGCVTQRHQQRVCRIDSIPWDLGGKAGAGADIGKIVNMMSGDASKVSQIFGNLYNLYGAPFEIIIASVFLYQCVHLSIRRRNRGLIPDPSGSSGTPHSSDFLRSSSLLLSTTDSQPGESSFLGAFPPLGTVVWLFSTSCLYPSSSSSYAHGTNGGSTGRNEQERRSSSGSEGRGGTRSGLGSSGPPPLSSSALLALQYSSSFKGAS